MAVLGALSGGGGSRRPASEHSYACFGAHAFPSSCTRTHMTDTQKMSPSQRNHSSSSAVILMGAECYFTPPLVTAVSGRRDELGLGVASKPEREKNRE